MQPFIVMIFFIVLMFGILIGYVFGRHVTTLRFSSMIMKDNKTAQDAIDQSYMLGVKHGKEQALKEAEGEKHGRNEYENRMDNSTLQSRR